MGSFLGDMMLMSQSVRSGSWDCEAGILASSRVSDPSSTGCVSRVPCSMGSDPELIGSKPINRVFCVNDRLVVSGDDEGVIKVSKLAN
jgi:hypothetical protein